MIPTRPGPSRAWIAACVLALLGCRMAARAADAPATEVDQLPAVATLPDPFAKADGTRIAGAAEWPAQRARLAELVQRYAYGHLPPAGTVSVTAVSTVHDDALHASRQELLLGMGPEGKLAVHLHLAIPDGPGPFAAIIVGDVCWGRQPEPILAAVIARGYLLAEFDRTEVAPDKPDRSVGLYAAYPDSDGGAVAAWAWGYQRVVDALLTLPAVDAKRIVVTGHSRGGKAVLLAGALDERIALTAPNGSGCFGAGCLRVLVGKCEDLDRIVKVFPYWFSARLAAFSGHADRLPFDLHTLKALVAPRALLTTEGLDDTWANPGGTQLTWQAAKVVYGFLGAGERIGIAYRPGGHAHSLPDWEALLDFADRQLAGKPVARRFDQLAFPDQSAAGFTWTAP
jgi:dienelactone hydrolase